MSLPIAFGGYDNDPARYFIDRKSGLWKAVEIALQLGRPLLLTGEPGTGKTQLAYYAAWQLNKEAYPVPFLDKPFIFHSKTTSVARDLFYYYDAVGHFQDKTGKDVRSFISMTAMGQAVMQSLGKDHFQGKEKPDDASSRLHEISNFNQLTKEPRSSVVLIDEIDKAPRDFPNDLLNEIENNEFSISEINETVRSNKNLAARMLVILTSNDEKSLPDAFLRRCIYYNVPFPEKDALNSILKNKIQPFLAQQKIDLDEKNMLDRHWPAVEYFIDSRMKNLQKLPATSELIDWIKVLHLNNFFDNKPDFKSLDPTQTVTLLHSFHTLFKSEKDLAFMRSTLNAQ